jgi:hypothetical protein
LSIKWRKSAEIDLFCVFSFEVNLHNLSISAKMARDRGLISCSVDFWQFPRIINPSIDTFLAVPDSFYGFLKTIGLKKTTFFFFQS